MVSFDLNSDTGGGRILLAGAISRAFSDTNALAKLSCEVQENMLDAIDAAAKGGYAAIAVVMAETSGKLTSVLKALRQANSQATIYLLAQMYEEPAARKLISVISNGRKIVDDYLICPIRPERFYQSIIASSKSGDVETAVVDANIERKVRLLEKLATCDELTGLKNRRYIWEFARQIIARAAKENGRVTLLMFDIDNFKHYNDVYSHSAGDDILKQAAVLMQHSCREHDVVGRIGGDEFIVVFWDDPKRRIEQTESERRSTAIDHPKEPIFIARRFRREVQKAELPMLGPEGKGVLTISGGLASFPRDGRTVEELFRQADRALLDAKRSGKNRIYLVGKSENDIENIQ